MPVSDKPFGEFWIADCFTMVDRLDPDELVIWYTDNGSFRFANQEPAKVKPPIRQCAGGSFKGALLLTSVRAPLRPDLVLSFF